MEELKAFAEANHDYIDEESGARIKLHFLIGGTQMSNCHKKKIDKSIDFLRGGEKKIVSIFHLRHCEEVEVSGGLNKAGFEIYNKGSLDISTLFGLRFSSRSAVLACVFPF